MTAKLLATSNIEMSHIGLMLARKYKNANIWIGWILWLSLFCNYIGGFLNCLTSTLLSFTILHFTLMHCTALHCTALHCTTLHCTTLHCTALHCTALHCTTLKFTALHCTEHYWNILHGNALQLGRITNCLLADKLFIPARYCALYKCLSIIVKPRLLCHQSWVYSSKSFETLSLLNC